MKNRVLLVWNGSQYNIAGAVSDYIIRFVSEVIMIANPLLKEPLNERSTVKVKNGSQVGKTNRKSIHPPLSFVFDYFNSSFFRHFDVVISFSSHLTPFLIMLRKMGRIERVIHWNIDFSPVRFRNSGINGIYNYLDKLSYKYSDIQVDLTQKAANARSNRHGKTRNKHLVIPVGIWEKDLATTGSESFREQNIVFLGNLAPRLGIELFLKSISLVLQSEPNAKFHVIGTGDCLIDLKIQFESFEKDGKLIWHGNKDESGIKSILSHSMLALAPYIKDAQSFSNYADPSKIKHYLQHGLPIVMTNVPPISDTLFQMHVALEVDDNELSIANGIVSILKNELKWKDMAKNSSELAKEFTWERNLSTLFSSLD
jgi:glycosyltransferase involved in cell wall biosynthesis